MLFEKLSYELFEENIRRSIHWKKAPRYKKKEKVLAFYSTVALVSLPKLFKCDMSALKYAISGRKYLLKGMNVCQRIKNGGI